MFRFKSPFDISFRLYRFRCRSCLGSSSGSGSGLCVDLVFSLALGIHVDKWAKVYSPA